MRISKGKTAPQAKIFENGQSCRIKKPPPCSRPKWPEGGGFLPQFPLMARMLPGAFCTDSGCSTTRSQCKIKSGSSRSAVVTLALWFIHYPPKLNHLNHRPPLHYPWIVNHLNHRPLYTIPESWIIWIIDRFTLSIWTESSESCESSESVGLYIFYVPCSTIWYHVALHGTSKTMKYELSSLFCGCIRPIDTDQCRTSYASCFTAF